MKWLIICFSILMIFSCKARRNQQAGNADLKEEGIYSSDKRKKLDDYVDLMLKVDPQLKDKRDLVRKNLKRVFESSVRLTVMNNKNIVGRGTGFFINDSGTQKLLTAGHVVLEEEHKKENLELDIIATTYSVDANQNIQSYVQRDQL